MLPDTCVIDEFIIIVITGKGLKNMTNYVDVISFVLRSCKSERGDDPYSTEMQARFHILKDDIDVFPN